MDRAHETTSSPDIAQDGPKSLLDELQQLQRTVTQVNTVIVERQKGHRETVTRYETRFKTICTKLRAGIRDAEVAASTTSDKRRDPDFYAHELLLIALMSVTEAIEFLQR